MKKISVFICLAFTSICLSQDINKLITKKDSQVIAHKQSVYYVIQRAWIANQDVSYASLSPYIVSVGNRRIPLREGENKSSNFYLLEAKFDLRFPLSKDQFTDSPIKKRIRWTFDYIGNFRMTNDKSHPLTPGSHSVGFGVNINLFNNYTGVISSNEDSNYSQQSINSKPINENIKFINFLFNIHHYSNGQPSGYYYTPDINYLNEKRNDYLSGDFSTNYIYLEFTKGTFNKRLGSIHQLSLGTRIDIGTEESLFAYSKEQENSYGRNRLLLKYDYRTERFGKDYEHHLRFSFEHILGNLSRFQPNLINDSKKYRSSLKALYEFAPKTHKSIGYFIASYYGRDYLNIRFDDIVFSMQAGITISLDKYFTPETIETYRYKIKNR